MCLYCALPSHHASYMLPKRSVWVLLLWWADYVGALVGLVGLWPSWLLGPALCGCCWLLVTRQLTAEQSWRNQAP